MGFNNCGRGVVTSAQFDTMLVELLQYARIRRGTMNPVLDATLIALIYYLVNLDCPLLMMCQAPLFLGGLFGAIYGDLTTGIMLGDRKSVV